MWRNYYEILGVGIQATEEEMKRAYRDLAKRYHPDIHKGNPGYEEKFKLISEAYTTLSNPEKRKKYDLKYGYYMSSGSANEGFESERRENPPPGFNENTTYNSGKREYTPNALMWGKIFIAFLIVVILLFPYLLMQYSSEIRYEEGLEHEKNGNYHAAVLSYQEAINFWGSRNLEAGMRSGMVLFRHIENYDMAYHQLMECFDYTESDSVEAILYFYLSLSTIHLGDVEKGLILLDSAYRNGFNQDSIHMVQSEINTYNLGDYEKGLESYNYLIDHNYLAKETWFGKAWCEQNTGKFQESIQSFSEAINRDPEFALAYFYRGVSYYYANDTIRGCDDIGNAIRLGYSDAEETYRINCRQVNENY